MNKLPPLIQKYLSRLWLDAERFSYLSFDKKGCIQSWHPDIEYYGIIDLQINDHVSDKLIFLEGWFSSDQAHDIFVLDFVNFEHGIIADIHILPSLDETHVLFIDVSEKFRQHQSLQQERHNIDLLNQQQVKNIQLLSQNYEEMVAKRRQIETINKSKAQLLSCITNDVRTPLSAILGFAQFLKSGVFGDLNSKQQECVNDIAEAGAYMTGLINEILEMTHLEDGNFDLLIESLSIKNLLEENLSLSAPLLAAHGIKLINHVQEDIKIEVDRKGFQRVFQRLMTNAIRYNRKEGCIVVSYRLLGEKLCLCIKDTGIGMTNDKLGRIFQPFVDNLEHKDAAKEEEMGLGACRHLVGLMSGSLSVCSEVNVGSVFYLEFPLSTVCLGLDTYRVANEFIYFYDDMVHFDVLKNLLLTYKGYELKGYHYSEDIHALNLQKSSTFILLDVDKNDVLFKLKLLKLLKKTKDSPTLLAIFEGRTEAINIRYVLEETLIDDYLTRPFDFNQLLDVFER